MRPLIGRCMNIFRISETKIFIRGHDRGWALQPVDVDPASNLGMTIKSSQFETFSAHHQAVHFVPKGLLTVAVASVEIIEGLEDQTTRFVVVQWHPEVSAGTYYTQQLLFNEWVNAAKFKKN